MQPQEDNFSHTLWAPTHSLKEMEILLYLTSELREVPKPSKNSPRGAF